MTAEPHSNVGYTFYKAYNNNIYLIPECIALLSFPSHKHCSNGILRYKIVISSLFHMFHWLVAGLLIRDDIKPINYSYSYITTTTGKNLQNVEVSLTIKVIPRFDIQDTEVNILSTAYLTLEVHTKLICKPRDNEILVLLSNAEQAVLVISFKCLGFCGKKRDFIHCMVTREQKLELSTM